MSESQILVTVSGPDHPGITAELMKCIMNSGVRITDMGQAITHGLLSLSFLLDFEFAENAKDSPLLKDLLFVAKQMNMDLDFEYVAEQQLTHPKGHRYIISCVALKGLTAGFLYEVSSTLAKNNINIRFCSFAFIFFNLGLFFFIK